MFKVIFIVSTSLYVASGNKNIHTFNIKADVHGGSIKEDIVVDLQKKLLTVNVGSVAHLNSDCPSTINLHDFKKGKLGIKNIDTGECLMIDTGESLNATLELLYKIKRLKLTHVIDEVKLVDPVPITEQEMLQEGGEYIADFCSGYKLFFGNIVEQNVHHAETRIKRAGRGSSKKRAGKSMMTFTLTVIRCVCFELILFAVCLFGDNYIGTFGFSIFGLSNELSKALLDNLTHGFVGYFTWAIIVDLSDCGKDLIECSGCMMLAMIIDIDHFIAARSIKLKSALSLHNRPIFHASSIIPVAVGCIWFISYLRSNDILKRLSLIFLVAWTSHHIRDGTRRGLWFPPFGSTQPLPKTTYVILIMCLPLLLRGVLYLTEQRQSYINPIQRELVKV